MSDNLRDRIAAILSSKEVVLDGDYINRECAWLLADAVIAEMGLRQEWSVEYTPSGEWPRMPQRYEWSCGHERTTEHRDQSQFDAASFSQEPGEQAHPVSRYITDWKADDE